MAVGYPMQQFDIAGSFLNGMQQGEQRQDRNSLRQLMGPAMQGDEAAMAQIAAISPQHAQAADNAHMQQLKKIRGAALYVKSALERGGPEKAAQAYQAVGPFLSQLTGRPVPPFDPSHTESLDALLAQTAFLDEGGDIRNNVQSTYVDGSGNRIAVLRSGQTINLGPSAESLRPIETSQGVGAFNPNGGNVRPATWQGPQPQAQFQLDDAALEALRSVPPEERATALAAMQSGGTFHVGEGGAPVAGLSSGAMVQPPPDKPAVNAEEYGQPQTVMVDGKPTLMQFGNQGGQRPISGAAPPESKQGRVSATQMRQANAAKQKLIDLQSLRNQLALVRQKFQPLQGSVSAGPFGQGYLPTESGRRYDAAVALLQQQVRKLTRTPGEGAMSDWEGKLALLANPDRNDYESVTTDKLDQLDTLVNQIQQGYEALLQDNQADEAPSAAPSVIRYDAQGRRIP